MSNYRICTTCIMDTSDPDISFDENGICNYCRVYKAKVLPSMLSPEQAKIKFRDIIKEIKRKGEGKEYDSILGLSGGTDSSYLAYLAKTNGLRPLLIHIDNGWDAEFAKRNIEKIVNKTKFDFCNWVLDWEEFKDLQLAYFRASVVDIEVPTDHAIMAVLFHLASHFDIKYILSGINDVTEAFIPRAWIYPKLVLANLLAIHEKFGKIELKTFPTLGCNKIVYFIKARSIKAMALLDFCDYNPKRAKQQLKDEFDWEDYSGKHYESIFTKFYQAYILPYKFGIDKRRAHLSNLICSGQTTREEALKEIAKPLYFEDELIRDHNYVIKKLGLTYGEFEAIMALPIVSHNVFPSGDKMTLETKALLEKE